MNELIQVYINHRYIGAFVQSVRVQESAIWQENTKRLSILCEGKMTQQEYTTFDGRTFKVGDRVKNGLGNEGTVIEFDRGTIKVQFDGIGAFWKWASELQHANQ